jgi:hypothetical protein
MITRQFTPVGLFTALCRFDSLGNRTFLFIPASHVPVVDETAKLNGLCRGICCVTCEEQVISGLDAPRCKFELRCSRLLRT